MTYTWEQIKALMGLVFCIGVFCGVLIDIYILNGYYKESLRIGFDEYRRQVAKKCQECANYCQGKSKSENTEKHS